MTSSDRRVIGGVDAHADTHDAAALDERGRRLGTQSFSTDAAGQRALLAWLEQFGELSVIGVESTGSYAAGLVRYLRAHMVEVVEVNWPHAHAHGGAAKGDPIDAEMAARQALASDAAAVSKLTTGIVESIRQLRVARDSAVKARGAALCQLTDLIVTAPDELRDQLSQRKTTRGNATLCSRLRPRTNRLAEPAEAAKFALRSLARRIPELDEEITALDRHLTTLVATAAPRTTQLLGISTGHAGQPARHRRAEHRPPRQRPRLRGPLRRQPDPGLLRACKTSSRSPTASASSTSGSLTPRSKRVRGRLSAYANALESIAELQENVARAVSSTGSRRSPPPRRLHAGPGRGVHRRGPQAGQVAARTAPGSSVAADEPGAPARPRKRLRWAAQRVRLSAGDRPARP